MTEPTPPQRRYTVAPDVRAALVPAVTVAASVQRGIRAEVTHAARVQPDGGGKVASVQPVKRSGKASP